MKCTTEITKDHETVYGEAPDKAARRKRQYIVRERPLAYKTKAIPPKAKTTYDRMIETMHLRNAIVHGSSYSQCFYGLPPNHEIYCPWLSRMHYNFKCVCVTDPNCYTLVFVFIDRPSSEEDGNLYWVYAEAPYPSPIPSFPDIEDMIDIKHDTWLIDPVGSPPPDPPF